MTIEDTTARTGSPLPKVAYTIANPVLIFLLRSPLHTLVSRSLMVLIFQGRKSGKRYTIPVGYVERGNHLFVFSHGAWSNNFRDGATVGVRLRGKTVRGRAQLLHDRARIADVVRLLIEKHGEAMAQRMGVAADAQGAPPVAASGTRYIEIVLEEVAP